MPGSLLCLAVVGVYLLALGMFFDNCGSLCAPVSGLIFSLGNGVESGQEVLYIYLVLDVHKASLELLSEVKLIADAYMAWWLSASSSS